MTELVCATNFTQLLPAHLSRHRCTVRDQHLETCLDEACGGCLPRRAARGYLCQHCYEKLDEALRVTAQLVEQLRSATVGRAPSEDRVSASMKWTLPGPEEWRAADELMEALGAPQLPSTATPAQARVAAREAVALWSDPERNVSTILGAVRAVEYFTRVQTIMHRWPEAESERVLPDRMRCHQCQQRGLIRRSPLEYLDDVEVVCPACHHVHDWWQLTGQITAAATAQIAADAAAAKRKKKK
jgi:hypothetical protein